MNPLLLKLKSANITIAIATKTDKIKKPSGRTAFFVLLFYSHLMLTTLSPELEPVRVKRRVIFSPDPQL